MSTDKLQALHNTVAEILSEPPSPSSSFDEEPYDAAQVSEQIAKPSDNLRRGTELPTENFGKATSRQFGIAPKEMRQAHLVGNFKNEVPGIVRRPLAEQSPVSQSTDAGDEQRSKLSHEAPRTRSDPEATSINTFGPAVSGNRISLGRWALRGIAGILLAASIGAALVTWLGSSGDAAKMVLTASPQPAPLAQTAPTAAALPPELIPLLQSMARDLASMGKEIEQFKAGRVLMARDNAKFSEQVTASQEQLTRAVAQLSEQLKASQEQLARDNASAAGQIKGIQEQLTSGISRASAPNAPPRIAAAPPRPTPSSPRPAAPAVRKPVPILPSPQATTRPNAEKPNERPRLSSTSRPPAPAR